MKKRNILLFVLFVFSSTFLYSQQKYKNISRFKYDNVGYIDWVSGGITNQYTTINFLNIRFDHVNAGLGSLSKDFYHFGPIGFSYPFAFGKFYSLSANLNAYYLMSFGAVLYEPGKFGGEISVKGEFPAFTINGGYRMGKSIGIEEDFDQITKYTKPFDGFFVNISVGLSHFVRDFWADDFSGVAFINEPTGMENKRIKAPNPKFDITFEYDNDIIKTKKSKSIKVIVKNKGNGNAENVYVNLTEKTDHKKLLSFKSYYNLGLISSKSQNVFYVEIKSNEEVFENKKTILDFEVVEKDGFKFRKHLVLEVIPEREIEMFPPILSSNVNFIDSNGNQLLDANESGNIEIELKNEGKGNAWNVNISLLCTDCPNGITFQNLSQVSKIEPGKKQLLIFPISANMGIPSKELNFNIKINEANGFDANPINFTLNTQKFYEPELKIIEVAINDKNGKNSYGNGNSIIENMETIEAFVVIQNVGQGKASNIQATIKIDDNNIISDAKDKLLDLGNLNSNEYYKLTFSFIVNNRYNSKAQLPISILLSESYKKFGFERNLNLELNKTLLSATNVSIKGDYEKQKNIDNITLFESDVDKNIPITNEQFLNRYALIIGNEDYNSMQSGLSKEVNVDFAMNDAKIFKEYCIKTLGIPEKQIKLLINATAGQMNQGVSWLCNLAKVENGNAELIFYYSGHGLPDEQSKESFLMPVDISGYNVNQGIKLSELYNKLSEHPAVRITVFLDACFSGGARNQGLISMKGVKVKPKENLITGNMIVFTSSTGEESSGVFREKQHGYLTYFLLKKLQESKGTISYKKLADYVIESVKKETALTGKLQTPQLFLSHDIEVIWEEWTVN